MTVGKFRMGWRGFVLCAGALLLASCASSSDPYVYRFEPGKTAILRRDGLAAAPRRAPAEVHRAIAAGNGIAGSPYRMGGGHGGRQDGCFDCSGATSYVLRNAGLMRGSMPSSGFRKYGKKGEGDWITVYAKDGHVFLVVAGLRFDTGWSKGPRGPKWTTKTRPTDRYTRRHPPGL